MNDILNYSYDKPWFFTNFSFLLALGVFLIFNALFYNWRVLRKLYVILFSLFFYYKSSGPFLLIFAGMIFCDYNFAQGIEKLKNVFLKKILLLVSILISLSFLLYFKYSGFFIGSVNDLFGTGFKVEKLFLPIGISFYTFQSISYIVDVYNGKISSSRNFVDYSFYMTFFPHLVAGPIVRAKDFIPQINNPVTVDLVQLKEALFRIVLGLSKKLIIADFIAKYVDMVQSQPKLYSGVENLIAMYGYSCQIYFDFSGYSDIAIGIAMLMGYQLKENFDNPYRSENITDFWRRWHISLSSWLRDYIYIPLGGSRKGKFFTFLFLMITMTVGGFWHGASWGFVCWGMAQGIALIAHKLLFANTVAGKKRKAIWRILGIFFTFNFISFFWILFRAQNFEKAFDAVQKIFFDFRASDFIGFYLFRKEIIFMLLFSFMIIFINPKVKGYFKLNFTRIPLVVIVVLMALFFQFILQIRSQEIAPFIYFQF